MRGRKKNGGKKTLAALLFPHSRSLSRSTSAPSNPKLTRQGVLVAHSAPQGRVDRGSGGVVAPGSSGRGSHRRRRRFAAAGATTIHSGDVGLDAPPPSFRRRLCHGSGCASSRGSSSSRGGRSGGGALGCHREGRHRRGGEERERGGEAKLTGLRLSNERRVFELPLFRRRKKKLESVPLLSSPLSCCSSPPPCTSSTTKTPSSPRCSPQREETTRPRTPLSFSREKEEAKERASIRPFARRLFRLFFFRERTPFLCLFFSPRSSQRS